MVLLLTKVQKIPKSQCKAALATLTLWFQRATLFHFTHAQLWLDDFFREKRSSPALLFGNFTVLSLRASSRETFVITIHKLFKEQWHFLTNEKKKKKNTATKWFSSDCELRMRWNKLLKIKIHVKIEIKIEFVGALIKSVLRITQAKMRIKKHQFSLSRKCLRDSLCLNIWNNCM